MIFKDACTDLYNWIVKNNLFNKVKIYVGVHDEINCQFPEKISKFPNILQNIMENFASKYCYSLPIIAVPDATKFWRQNVKFMKTISQVVKKLLQQKPY